MNSWTLEAAGSKQVALAGAEDKREITCLLGCTLSGHMLPPELIYQGKTERCHATVAFPEGWDIWHSDSHWCTHLTMQRYVAKILQPWLEQKRKELGLPQTQKAVVVLDVYKAHRTPDVLQVFKESGFELVYVPANCTSELQPLDVAVNSFFKAELKDQFTTWYAERVQVAIKQHSDNVQAAVQSFQPDFRLSVVKPLHARWVIEAFNDVRDRKELIQSGWSKAGISNVTMSSTRSHDISILKSVCDKSNLGHPGPKKACAPAVTIEKPCMRLLPTEIDSLAFSEHYFHGQVSQSRIDGRLCAVIATLTAHRVLTGILPLPNNKGGYPPTETLEVLVVCMRQGNHVYDSKKLTGLLTVDQALEALSAIDIRVQREIFLTQEKGWKQVVFELLQAAKNSATSQAAGVLVTSPFSVMLAATAGGCLYVFDSHSHGPHRGALLAVPTVSATNGSMTAYISRFFNKHFALRQNIRLSNGTTVGREYHFVLFKGPRK